MSSQGLNFSAISSQFGFLEGKILTVVEAAIADAEQRKALKDIVRGYFRDQLSHMHRCVNSTSQCQTPASAPRGD